MAIKIRNTKTSLSRFYGSRERVVHISTPFMTRYDVGKGTVYKREERRAPRENRKARASQRAKSGAVAFEKRMG